MSRLHLVVTAFILLAAGAPLVADPESREKIGEVQGKPVYRDEIRSKTKSAIATELHVLFARPAAAKYRKRHKAEIEPTEAELAAAQEVFDRQHAERIRDELPELREKRARIEEQLKAKDLSAEQREKLEHEREFLDLQSKPPGRMFASFMLKNWKFQKHLYDTYGGGRILWQQAGLEAYDANRKWLEDLEANGEFKITDPKLRTAFYEYWNSQDGSPFLTEDPERIRKEFLEPEWAPAAKAKPDAK